VRRLLWPLLLTLPGLACGQSIAFISDLNGRYGSTSYHERVHRAVDTLVEKKPDLVVSTGDMVAGQKQPQLDQARLDLMWQAFNTAVADPLASATIPLAVTPGNHDGSAFPGFALERERFAAQWSSRTPGLAMLPGSEWPRRYAALLEDILLITFDGTRPGALPAAEFAFVERMLREHGARAHATVVFSHLPLWPFARGREQETLDDARFLRLLQHNGVDVYASGHHHVLYAGRDETGMIHLSAGALGGNARAFSAATTAQRHGFALLEFTPSELVAGFRVAPGFNAAAPLDDLPATISGPLGTLTRLDGPALLR
jgi:predicted phosphodiesterase